MLSRLIIGTFGIVLLLFIFLMGNLPLLVFSEVVILISTIELYMMAKKNDKVYFIRAIVLAFLTPIVFYFNLLDISSYLICSFLFITIPEILFVNIKDSSYRSSFTFFNFVYISILFSYILKLQNLNYGNELIILSFILIWSADSFAYLFGMLIGKHKFSIISPKKSIEGLVGAFIGVLLTLRYFGYIIYFITYLFSHIKILNIYPRYVEVFNSFSIKLFGLSLFITMIAVLGDLFESKIKREFNTKDSSNLLLGHGGFLDRFDSSLFVIPVIYILVRFMIIMLK
ncbi:phosphatidate cytidylyltransferase [Oceanivirga miroungae]|uniref:Phosphatidate cytidylyltransferase n=1 Tax=Oceanivirga miroungae TaxID=1130046 RepID=A0A6I8M9B3_9FUSO|nr:phosphatidate cytidylyltransferase [Oceanivirga miroungae]VWL84883.1 phosphatidate cytidylyltransferase [Oceanivirga miroungae]